MQLFDRFLIAEGEVLVAAGEYAYVCNGSVTDIAESWWVHRRGEQLYVRSERRVPAANLAIQVYAEWSAGIVLNSKLVWQVNDQVLTQAHYDRAEKNKTGEQGLHFSLSKNQLFFPHMRIFMGQIIHQLLAAGGSAKVVVPWIKDPSQTHKLLQPSESIRKTRLEGEDAFQLGEQSFLAKRYSYEGDQYQDGSSFWLQDGYLVRYQWAQGEDQHWDVQLRNFKREDERLLFF